jgi:hypothetical protein
MRRRLTSAAASAAVALAVACQSLSTDPNEIVSIDFPPPPLPAMVAGDSLRDATGAAVPLAATLFDAEGNPVEEPITFLTPDTLVIIGDDGAVVAKPNVTGTSRLLATGAGLQSVPRQIDVVPRPDRVTAGAAADTIRFLIPDDPRRNASKPVDATVESFDAASQTYKGVNKWIVTYRLRFRGQDVAPGDTSVVFLQDDTGRPSTVDTTDASGKASRTVRYRVTGGVSTADTIFVTAEARYKGGLVSGAPVRKEILVVPAGATASAARGSLDVRTRSR